MKTTGNKTKLSRSKMKIMHNNLMKRFLFEIQKEEPLEDYIVESVVVLQPVRTR